MIAWDPDAPDGFMTDFDEVEPTDFDRPELTLEDPGMILYTSGTTAMPKGCVLSHEALVRPAYAMRDRFALTDEDRMWDALPLFHLASLLPLHACMLAGASYVAMRRFDPAEALAQMERERCTTAFPAFETVWLAILNHPNYESTDLSSMRLRAQRRHARAPRADAGDDALGDADQLLRLHRTRRRVRVRPHRGPARAARHDVRAPVPGHGDPDHRPRDRRAEAGRARSARSSAAATRCSAAITASRS